MAMVMVMVVVCADTGDISCYVTVCTLRMWLAVRWKGTVRHMMS